MVDVYNVKRRPLVPSHYRSLCVVVVSYDSVAAFIRLVLEQYYERCFRMTDPTGQRDDFACTTSLWHAQRGSW